VAAGRVPAWFSVSSLGQRWPWRGPCSAFAVADRGCATKALRRGGRRVEVLTRPPTARAGWLRSRPGRDSSVFLPARARMGLRSREALLWRAAAAIASLHGYPQRRVADQVAVGNSGSVVELERPGGSQVDGVDLGGCPPHLHVGDQLGRNESAPDSRPGRRFTCGVADLVGELSNQA
jgi:hypothetical protein